METKEHQNSEANKERPPRHEYRIHIDGEVVEVETQHPTGELLLKKVGKRPCAFELIEELQDHENDVVEPDETVDLETHGLKRFITAHKEVVTIFVNGNPYPIDTRGTHGIGDSCEGWRNGRGVRSSGGERRTPVATSVKPAGKYRRLRDLPLAGTIRQFLMGGVVRWSIRKTKPTNSRLTARN